MWFPKKHRLPVGMTEFEYWTSRIVSRLDFPLNRESVKFVLANEITRLGDSVDSIEDEYFIARIHKFAANQIAQAKKDEVMANKKLRAVAEEEAKKSAETQNITAIQ